MFYVDLGAISIHVFDKDCVCTEDIEINETNMIIVLNHFGTWSGLNEVISMLLIVR